MNLIYRLESTMLVASWPSPFTPSNSRSLDLYDIIRRATSRLHIPSSLTREIISQSYDPDQSNAICRLKGLVNSLANIISSVLSATGLVRLRNSVSLFDSSLADTHYPSTPLEKACRLSSCVAKPVKANILARACTTFVGATRRGTPRGGVLGRSGTPIGCELCWLRLEASTLRIARVEVMPSIIGMDISIKITLKGTCQPHICRWR
jgi:hypothetical protein